MKKTTARSKTSKPNVISRGLVRVSMLRMWQQMLLFALVVAIVGSSSILIYRSFAATQVQYWNLTRCKSSNVTLSTTSNSSHPCVVAVQKIVKYDTLTNNGCPGASSIATDGDFGPITSKYVKCFQKYHGLSGDGIVGPKTYTKMIDVCWYYVNNTSKSYLLVNYCGAWSTNPAN